MSDLLTSLSAFLRVCQTLNFTRAAESLGLSRAVLSRRIQALEKDVGAPLFYRTTRQVTLTSVGIDLQAKASNLVLESQKLVETMQANKKKELTGRVHVSATVIIAWTVLQALIAAFMEIHPKVRFELTTEDMDVNLLERGIDIAFKVGNNPSPDLVAKKLGYVENVLVGSPKYFERHEMPETPDELKNSDFLVNTYLGGVLHLRKTDGQECTVDLGNSSNLLCNNAFLNINGCRLGFGIAMLPADLIADQIKEGKFIRVLPDWTLDSFNFYALYISRHLSPASRSFLSFVAEKLAAVSGKVYSKELRSYQCARADVPVF